MFGIPSMFAAINRLTKAINNMADMFEHANECIADSKEEDVTINRITDLTVETNGKKTKK